jgi:CheY-like chemotaxis protein
MEVNKRSLNGKTFLIVEDDYVSTEYLKEIFSEKGVTLIFVNSGEEAIKEFKANDQIDLVLMDIRLPGVDGYETTRMLKAMNPAIPVLAQTAYAMQGDRKKSLDAGCDEYIAKPLRSSELLNIIYRLI